MKTRYIPQRLVRLAACALLAALAAPALAQYVWLDEKGVKQYSDMPPPASVPTNRILKQPGGSATRNQPGKVETQSPTAAPTAAPTLAEQNAATAAIATAAQATANNATASALWKMEATSSPSGTDTRVGTYLRTDTGSGYVSEAFEYLDIQADGSTRKVTNVDLYEVAARDGSAAFVFDTRVGNCSIGSTT